MVQQPIVGKGICIIMITLRHITVGRTPLDEWSARRRDLYVTRQSTHKTQTSMSLAEFEPATPPSERPQTRDLRPRGHWDLGHNVARLKAFRNFAESVSLLAPETNFIGRPTKNGLTASLVEVKNEMGKGRQGACYDIMSIVLNLNT